MDRRGFLGLAAGSAWDHGRAPERVSPPAGGRVTRSTTEYLANNSVFNVLDYGARRDGSDDGPAIRRALDAASAAQGTLVFPPGTYSYARSPNFAQDNLEILGQGRVTLRHTGQGVGFVVDGWLQKFGRRVWNMRIENLTLEGNPGTTVGFLFRSIHHGRFARLRVTGGAPEGEGFRTEFFIANYCEGWVVSGSEPVAGSLPGTGITLSSLAAPHESRSTVDCTLTNFIVEGCARVGVHLDRAQHNLIRGGTFEHNHTGTGLLVSPPASGNVVDGVFLEWNRLHIDCRGPQNQFLALSAARGVCRFHEDASFSRLIGGRFGDLAIESGVRDVKLLGVAATRIADRGLRTQRLGCHDLRADHPVPDQDGAARPAIRWQAPVLEAPWTNTGGDTTPAGFMRDAEGRVRLRGRLTRTAGKGGKRGQPLVVFTLPVEYRPRYRHRFPVLSQGKLGILEIEPGGRVVLVKGGQHDLSLDGIMLVEEPEER
ncbi:MAG: glycosyl hydrolase family 28-related protein [Gemmatimonadales bacterium]